MGKSLHRIMRTTSSGWEYESDQHHAQVLVDELELAGKQLDSSLGVDEVLNTENKTEVDPSQPLRSDSATANRAVAARCDYIAVDLADC